MAESSNVRLVRCPKCENLLPELPGYSVYQCGGCGAVLRASKANPEGCQRSDEEETVEAVISGKNDSLLGKSKTEDAVEKVTVSGAENVKSSVTDSEVGKLDSKQEMGKLNCNLESDAENNVNGSRRSTRVSDPKPSEDRFKIRHSTSNQVCEGSSKYGSNSRHRNPDREELLRKLDELKEELSKVPLKDRIPDVEPYVECDGYFRDHPSNVHRVSRQFSAGGAPYYDHCRDPFRVRDRADMASHNYHNLIPTSNHVPSYGDPFECQMFQRPPPRITPDYLSCSCYHCYDREPRTFGNRRFPRMGSRMFDESHARWPNELNLETGSFPRGRPQRVRLGNPSRYSPAKHTSTEDYANSVYDFQPMDREREPISSSKSEETHNLHSVSGTTSENECFSDDEPLETEGSPFQDPFDHSSKHRAVTRCGKGNLSSRSDHERVMSNKRQNSLKESLATEINSVDVYRDDDQPKPKKGVDAFLTAIIKKTIQSEKRNVSINGHLIQDRSVKKAEKLAGPIFPGRYWYDSRAGFWGLMGGPCLGIIPPSIEEFSNYPMPEKCAGGNTGVFVNGRELNQKDFDLLVSRGLPPARNRSYVIEISGRVVDESSGLELDGLGKLAPTVEKVKHGFGMRALKTDG